MEEQDKKDNDYEPHSGSEEVKTARVVAAAWVAAVAAVG